MSARARTLTKAASLLYGAMLVVASAPASAVITISNTPLFLAVTVPPNLVLTLDDSGSMRRAFVPENCLADTSDCAALDNRYEKSARRNLIHYNPNVTYPQPRNAAGAFLTTSFTAAWRNGFDTAFGSVNLSSNYRPTSMLDLNGTATEDYMGHFPTDSRCTTVAPFFCQIATGNAATPWAPTSSIGATACVGTTSTARNTFCRGADPAVPAGVPAYYYVFDATNSNCNGTDTDNDCYDIKIVSATSGPGGTDERQNFANWFSFARTRNLATQTAASLAFSTLDPSVRVGYQALNSCRGSATSLNDTDCDGWKNNFTNFNNAVRPFTGTHRNNFFSWIQQQPTAGGTPLPEAMARAGAYFSVGGENSAYDNDFTTAASGQHACRRNYHILMTDGIWTTGWTTGDRDAQVITLPVPSSTNPVITQYAGSTAAAAPYRDPTPSTLADVAFHYWITDLRPGAGGLPNIVPASERDATGLPVQRYWNPRNDPATWQHMVNYTIGLGLTGYLSAAGLTWTGDMYDGSYPSIASGATAWPAASTATNNPANVADLWHAAINSRGQFFSADDPASLSAAFRQALVGITGSAGSSAALSTNSTSIQPNSTVVYQAKFDGDWSGTLLALPVASDGSVGVRLWDSSTLIPPHATRRIFTHNGTMGVEFLKCADLNPLQQLALGTNSSGIFDGRCDDRLQWLRGNPTHEERNQSILNPLATFRNRTRTVMGDIINSDPAYVQDLDYRYSLLPASTPGQSTYAAYVAANANRQEMVYVGSNDGKLYGINATTGIEAFSYVPAAVYSNLTHLTDPLYTHRFYVDGGITVGDAYLFGTWRTVLVAGLNAGGNSIYAIDVADADATDQNDVMWEFTDPDMGMTYSQPQVGILENGEWVAIFGNGYNSTNGGAYLYVVRLRDGVLLQKILASDVAGDESNGLSTPFLFDADNDRMIDAVYAGDLAGNMWKFDVSGLSGSFAVAFPPVTATTGGTPLFRARSATGVIQPITAQPKVAGHPLGGQMVTFGTGRYLTPSDPLDLSVQTFYGVRDNGAAIITTDRSELQQQTISLQQQHTTGRWVRSVTGATPDWTIEKGWYLDLVDRLPAGTFVAAGERVVSTPIIKFDRVIFVTVVPSTDPCLPGGTSWLMELNLVTGGTFAESILDVNDDGNFNDFDNVGGQVVSGVRMDGLGISKTPVWLDCPSGDCAFKIMTGTSGNFGSERNRTPNPPPPVPGQVTRRSWIQIR